jgi:hypothetical protein
MGGAKKKRIAAQLSLDVKTVRRYVRAAESVGLAIGAGELTDEQVGAVLLALQPTAERLHGEGWQKCEAERAEIKRLLEQHVRLSKVCRLLHRRGVEVPYSTLHRFAVAELDFGRRAPTIPVADGKPGEEIHIDTGWMTLLEPDERGRRRRFRAWIFTPHVSRYRFVYPCFKESTESAIEACEAAWEFYDGVFGVVVPDNTKAIVHTANPLKPRIIDGFLEYAQARGFHVDPTRTRHPKDKARTERAVRDVRDDCFAGEKLLDLEGARARGRCWSAEEYGMRRHTRTQRLPREHFDAVEKPTLKPAPTAPYDIPLWADPKVAPDQHAQVARALYSLPREWLGKELRARADRTTVRFYDPVSRALVKTHPRRPPGGRSTDPADFPPEKLIYAMRDVESLLQRARGHGLATGEFAAGLHRVTPEPWRCMRLLFRLLGLVRRYRARRVDETCSTAIAADMFDLFRLERMLKLAVPPAPAPEPARVIEAGRFLRPASDYALPCIRQSVDQGDDS